MGKESVSVNLAWSNLNPLWLGFAQTILHRNWQITLFTNSVYICRYLLTSYSFGLSDLFLQTFGSSSSRALLLLLSYNDIICRRLFFKNCSWSRVKHLCPKVMQHCFVLHMLTCIDTFNRCHRILMIPHLVYLCHSLENIINGRSSTSYRS